MIDHYTTFLDADWNPVDDPADAVMVKTEIDGAIVFGIVNHPPPKQPKKKELENARGNWEEGKHPRDPKGEFTDKHGGQGVRRKGSGKVESKSDVSTAFYKPSDGEKQAIAEASEVAVASRIPGAKKNGDNDPIDVDTPKYNLEVKTFVDNKNSKITVHGTEDHDPIGAMNRKVLKAQDNNKPIITILHDMRKDANGKPADTWHIRESVGSFYQHTMQKISGPEAVPAWIKKNKAKIQSAHDDDVMQRYAIPKFGLTIKEATAYSTRLNAMIRGLPKKEARRVVVKMASETLKKQYALKKCNAKGKAIDKQGKVIK